MFGLYQRNNLGKIGETQTSFFPLKRGSINPYVWVLQSLLNGQSAANLTEDGSFGAGTEKAVLGRWNKKTVELSDFNTLLALAFPELLGKSYNAKIFAKISLDQLLSSQAKLVDSIALAQKKEVISSILAFEVETLQILKGKVYANFLTNASVKEGNGFSKDGNTVLYAATKNAISLGYNIGDVLIWDKLPNWVTGDAKYYEKAGPYAAQCTRLAFVSDIIFQYCTKYYPPAQADNTNPGGTIPNPMPWGNGDTVTPPSKENDNVPTGGNKRDLGETIDNLIYIGTIGAFVAIGAKVIGIISGTVASAGRQLKS